MLALGFILWAIVAQQSAAATAPSVLATAKELYVAADYEQALRVLATVNAAAEADEVDQYRALCFLALGRMPEVERVLESLVTRSPSFKMSATDVPPRLVAIFEDTHNRLLPDIAQARYTSARADFERRNYGDASAKFRALLALLDATRVSADARTASVVADVRELAKGFLELSEAARAPGIADVRVPDVPAAAPASVAAIPSPMDDRKAIERVVMQYADAYSALDADAVARVFPEGDVRGLQTAFDGLGSQKIEARDLDITLDAGGEGAAVRLVWAVDAVAKVGGAIRTQMPSTLRLVKLATGDWRIVERR